MIKTLKKDNSFKSKLAEYERSDTCVSYLGKSNGIPDLLVFNDFDEKTFVIKMKIPVCVKK